MFPPIELWEVIITHVADDLATLRSCALVDRRTLPFVRKYLFRSLRIADVHASLKLATVLDAHTSLGGYVIDLHLDASGTLRVPGYTPEDMVSRFAGRLPNLKFLTIRGQHHPRTKKARLKETFFSRIPTSFPSVISIKLELCTLPSLLVFQDFILALPLLRHLDMNEFQLYQSPNSFQAQWDEHLRAPAPLESITISKPYGPPQSLRDFCKLLVSTGLATEVQRMTLKSVEAEGWRTCSLIRCLELYCYEAFHQRIADPPIYPHTTHLECRGYSPGHSAILEGYFLRLTSLTLRVDYKSFCGHYSPFDLRRGINVHDVKIPQHCLNTLRDVHLIFSATHIHDVIRFRQEVLAEVEIRCILTTYPANILDDSSLFAQECTRSNVNGSDTESEEDSSDKDLESEGDNPSIGLPEAHEKVLQWRSDIGVSQ